MTWKSAPVRCKTLAFANTTWPSYKSKLVLFGIKLACNHACMGQLMYWPCHRANHRASISNNASRQHIAVLRAWCMTCIVRDSHATSSKNMMCVFEKLYVHIYSRVEWYRSANISRRKCKRFEGEVIMSIGIVVCPFNVRMHKHNSWVIDLSCWEQQDDAYAMDTHMDCDYNAKIKITHA